jgi:hypothetical protein
VTLPEMAASYAAEAKAQRARAERVATAVRDEVAAVLGVAPGDVRTFLNTRSAAGTVEVAWDTSDPKVAGVYDSAETLPWSMGGVGHGATLRELWARRTENTHAAHLAAVTTARERYAAAEGARVGALSALEDAVREAVQGDFVCTADVWQDTSDGALKIRWRAGGLSGAYFVGAGVWK